MLHRAGATPVQAAQAVLRVRPGVVSDPRCSRSRRCRLTGCPAAKGEHARTDQQDEADNEHGVVVPVITRKAYTIK